MQETTQISLVWTKYGALSALTPEMDLARILAAAWMTRRACAGMGRNHREYPMLCTGRVADHATPVEACWATCMQAGESEDARIQRELEIMYFYGCVLSIAEYGRLIVDADPERDILDTYARMFHREDYWVGNVDRHAMISEVVARRRFAEIQTRALASAVYLSNRKEKCVGMLPGIFRALEKKRYEVMVLAGSSMGIEWLSSALLRKPRPRQRSFMYIAAKKYLANRTQAKGRVAMLRKNLQDKRQNELMYLDMRRLILEAVGVGELSRITKVQKGAGMGVITASSISKYLSRDTAWIMDLMCGLCPKEMEAVCKDHEWSADELGLVVEGYYPQILQRMPLETLVAYLARRRGEQQGRVGLLPAIWVATRRVAATACRWYQIENIASREDLAQIKAIESEKNDALCAFFSSSDSMGALERGGLRRWIMMTRGPEAVRLVLWRMVEVGMLAGKVLDMDEAERILQHRRDDILQLVRDGGARLRLSPAEFRDLDKELLVAMEKSSTLEILEIEHNMATIEVLGDRRMWPLIEPLKMRVGPECATEIDTLMLSMAGDVAREYRDHLHTRSPAKRMRTGDAPVWAAQEPAEGLGLRE